MSVDLSRVKERIAELHYQRLRLVVPLMLVVSLYFVGADLLLLAETRGHGQIQVYLGLDVAFLVLHAVLAVALYRRPGRLSLAVVTAYAAVALAWAAVTGAIELQRTDNFTALYLSIFAVAALGLFSAVRIAGLIIATLVGYLAITAFWPGLSPPSLEKNVSLFALACLAFGISRTLYGAVVNNVLATYRLERANAELREARLSLIRQEKLAAVGVLSAGIAHEINNPLAFIQSNFAALERNVDSLSGNAALQAENRAIFEETREGFRRISEVVHALGAFGRELPPGERAPYDLNEGIRTTLVMARNETQGTTRVETDLGELPQVLVRGSEINQVLLNLLLNAFQAVATLPPQGDRWVKLRTRADSGSVTLEISNSGPPVPTAFRERIFDPFFSTKAPGSGMGLGLSLSWHIAVQRHDGELDLLPGEPVTFRLRLPRSPQST